MIAAVIGYGSIGQRHARILHQLNHDVCVVTCRRNAAEYAYPVFSSVQLMLERTAPDYVVIANETVNHFETLNQIRKLGYRRTVLVEKPLFGTPHDVSDTQLMNTFTAYNLRFHPILLRLKKLLQKKTVLSAQVYVGQYLPTWRQGNYRNSYSASRNQGGGALRDLSHELDYIQWLFGSWQQVSAIGGHFSALQIDSDDVFGLLLSTNNCPLVNIQLNYLDRLQQRQIIVNTDAETYAADLVRNSLTSIHGTVHFHVEMDQTYKLEHLAALNQDDTILCTAKDALQTDELIVSAEQSAQEGRWIHK